MELKAQVLKVKEEPRWEPQTQVLLDWEDDPMVLRLMATKEQLKVRLLKVKAMAHRTNPQKLRSGNRLPRNYLAALPESWRGCDCFRQVTGALTNMA